MGNVARVRAGLGRGLGALIPAGVRGVLEVDPGRIRPNPRQPRQRIDAEGLGELAESIRQHGLLQPLVVTRGDGDGDYVLIAGERRLEAARLAGIERVPVVVREATPEEMLELALVENIQRADLGPLEEAAAYHQLVEEFGLTQERVAARVGKSRAAVANSLRLLGLSEKVKSALWGGEITEGHGRALLGLEDERSQVAALEAVVRNRLSVRETEDLVRRASVSEPVREREKTEPAETDVETRAMEDAFRTALGTRVRLVRRGSGGQVIIHYYSEEQLHAIYEALVRE